MNRTVIRATKMPRGTKDEYLRYFRESTAEYHSRADRLEQRLLSSGTIKGSPDLRVQMPSWEVGDVCCFTNVTKSELQEVLPPLFDALRRLNRVLVAAMVAQDFRRASRLALAAEGIDAMLSVYLENRPGHAAVTEEKIDRWLGQMLGPCMWGDREHFGHRCQKPVAWTKVDMGGGRSEGASARALYAVTGWGQR